MDHENSPARWKCLMEMILYPYVFIIFFFVLPVWDPPSIPQMRWKGGNLKKATRKEEEEERYAIPLAIPWRGVSGELAGSRLFNM
jgi:hypothetical protein